MNRLLKMQVACLLIGAATVIGSGNAAAQGARPGNSDATAVPKVTGPIPVSSDSFPFLAADRNLQPTDLKKYGYVEEEFIVTGTANVYDWAADGALTVKTPGVPYGARVLVRHARRLHGQRAIRRPVVHVRRAGHDELFFDVAVLLQIGRLQIPIGRQKWKRIRRHRDRTGDFGHGRGVAVSRPRALRRGIPGTDHGCRP